CSSLQRPEPVSGSGVMLGTTSLNGSMASGNASWPAPRFEAMGRPSVSQRASEWQAKQWETCSTMYLPRANRALAVWLFLLDFDVPAVCRVAAGTSTRTRTTTATTNERALGRAITASRKSGLGPTFRWNAAGRQLFRVAYSSKNRKNWGVVLLMRLRPQQLRDREDAPCPGLRLPKRRAPVPPRLCRCHSAAIGCRERWCASLENCGARCGRSSQLPRVRPRTVPARSAPYWSPAPALHLRGRTPGVRRALPPGRARPAPTLHSAAAHRAAYREWHERTAPAASHWAQAQSRPRHRAPAPACGRRSHTRGSPAPGCSRR